MRVNPELVVKQGLLHQRGKLWRYTKQALFYLERRDEQTGQGPYLKYGPKGKTVKHAVDLSYRPVDEGFNGVLVVKQPESKRKFKVVTQELTVYLKAETAEERESWVQALAQETHSANAAVMQSLYAGPDGLSFAAGEDLNE